MQEQSPQYFPLHSHSVVAIGKSAKRSRSQERYGTRSHPLPLHETLGAEEFDGERNLGRVARNHDVQGGRKGRRQCRPRIASGLYVHASFINCPRRCSPANIP